MGGKERRRRSREKKEAGRGRGKEGRQREGERVSAAITPLFFTPRKSPGADLGLLDLMPGVITAYRVRPCDTVTGGELSCFLH